MPELPDVEVYRKEAQKAQNKRIDHINIIDKHFVDISKITLGREIAGKKLKEIYRRGKYLFLITDNHWSIVMHFGMTGRLEYLPADKEAPKYTKCTLEMSDNHHLHYLSKRKLGSVDITSDSEQYIRNIPLGPDVMELDKSEFKDKIKEKSSMVKTALMDQELMSGIGNVYSDEILFQSGLHPETKTSQLTGEQLNTLYENTQEVMKTAIECEADISKFPDNFLLANRDNGRDCPQCKGKIKKIKISGRTGYYCPGCQTKPKS